MPEFRIQKLGDLAYVEGTGKWKGCLEDIGRSEEEVTKLIH